MKKLVIGFLYSGKNIGKEEKMFLRQARKKSVSLVMINIFKKIDEKTLKRKILRCNIVYNNTAEDEAIEFIKTIENLGKKVVDGSNLYYYEEDKWMFYLKCKENNIPTFDTILLSEKTDVAKKELEEWGRWPVVLKRVSGTMGEYVEKADDVYQAVKIIKKFWKRGSQKLPIIAQEFVSSPSYRVTVIDGKIIQTARKKNNSWKATGVYAKKIERFPVNRELKKIIKKINKTMNIKICGIDLMKKGDKWYVLEVNTTPALDFFDEEQEKLVRLVLDFLKKEAKKQRFKENLKKHFKRIISFHK